MADRLAGVRLKIERAKKHILDLDEAIRVFKESQPYTIGAKPHHVPQIQHTTLFVASVQPVPSNISPIIGDAVHNLRSSLDHLAWQLVESGGGSPNKNTHFPICHGAQGAHKYQTAIGKGEIKRVSPGAERVLSAVQPYVTGDDTLWIIQELDNIDKHRLLITIVSTMKKIGIDVIRGHTLWLHEGRFFPLVAGSDLVSVPDDKADQNYKLGIDIAFGEPEIIKGNLVIFVLNQMVDFVYNLVGKFEGFLV
jgi:hypothetical protein